MTDYVARGRRGCPCPHATSSITAFMIGRARFSARAHDWQGAGAPALAATCREAPARWPLLLGCLASAYRLAEWPL